MQKRRSHAFDTQLRSQLLQQAEGEHILEIRRGLEWLRRSGEIPAVREVLEAAALRFVAKNAVENHISITAG
jgi:hypothetical protein